MTLAAMPVMHPEVHHPSGTRAWRNPTIEVGSVASAFVTGRRNVEEMDREELQEFAMSAVQELQERSEHFKQLAKKKGCDVSWMILDATSDVSHIDPFCRKSALTIFAGFTSQTKRSQQTLLLEWS